MGIKAIIFDLGNVLVDFDHRAAAKKISGFTDKTAEEIFELFFDSEITGLFEKGKISAQEFFLKVKEALNLRMGFEDFLPVWNQIFFLSEKNRAVYDLAVKLRSRYRTVVLTNINTLHYEYIKKNFPIFGPFHEVFASCELGFVKPDHEIYKKTLAFLGIPAGDAFYTDDRKELIDSARMLGIRGFVFSGVKQLKSDLLRAGVNPN